MDLPVLVRLKTVLDSNTWLLPMIAILLIGNSIMLSDSPLKAIIKKLKDSFSRKEKSKSKAKNEEQKKDEEKVEDEKQSTSNTTDNTNNKQ